MRLIINLRYKHLAVKLADQTCMGIVKKTIKRGLPGVQIAETGALSPMKCEQQRVKTRLKVFHEKYELILKALLEVFPHINVKMADRIMFYFGKPPQFFFGFLYRTFRC